MKNGDNLRSEPPERRTKMLKKISNNLSNSLLPPWSIESNKSKIYIWMKEKTHLRGNRPDKKYKIGSICQSIKMRQLSKLYNISKIPIKK